MRVRTGQDEGWGTTGLGCSILSLSPLQECNFQSMFHLYTYLQG